MNKNLRPTTTKQLILNGLSFVVYPFRCILPKPLRQFFDQTIGWHWSVESEYRNSRYLDEFRHITKRDLKSEFKALDKQSISEIIRYIRITQIFNIPEKVARFFYVWTHLDTVKTAEHRKLLEEVVKNQIEKFHLTGFFLDYSSLVFQHGLPLLPASILSHMRGKDFIDAGAYIGDSTLILLDYMPSKIHAFEPSTENQAHYSRIMNMNNVTQNQICLNGMGLSSTTGAGCLHNTGNMYAIDKQSGESAVEFTTVDDYVKEKHLCVGLIKGDLEGMGLELIKGALETIRTHRPVLSIAIYHNCDELFGVYRLITSMNLGYIFKIVKLCPPWQNIELTLLAYHCETPASQT